MELLVSTGAVLQQRKVEQAVDEAGPAGVQQALLLVEVFQVERADGGVRRRRRAGRRDGGGILKVAWAGAGSLRPLLALSVFPIAAWLSILTTFSRLTRLSSWT